MSSTIDSDSVFGLLEPAPIGATTVASAFNVPATVFVIPGKVLNGTEEVQKRKNVRLYLAAALAAMGTSEETDTNLWTNWIATLGGLLFDGFSEIAKTAGFEEKEFPKSLLDKAVDLFNQTATDPEIWEKEGLGSFDFGPSLPVDQVILGDWMVDDSQPHILNSFYSLVLFLAGKSINSANITSIQVNRPKALISKYKLVGTDLLNGPRMMSSTAHQQINAAWNYNHSYRKEVFKQVIAFQSSTGDLAKDIVWTTVGLMRYSGMQHAYIVHLFLKEYPWAIKLPILSSGLHVYEDSLLLVSKDAPHLRPYHKLLNSDKSTAFNRKGMAVLLTVAVHAMTPFYNTLTRFVVSDEVGDAIEVFDRALKEHTAAPTASVLID